MCALAVEELWAEQRSGMASGRARAKMLRRSFVGEAHQVFGCCWW